MAESTPIYGIYRGEVAHTDDPEQRGRLQLRVPQVLGTSISAWAEASDPPANLPEVGDWVWVQFTGGDASKPVYISYGGGKLIDQLDILNRPPTLQANTPVTGSFSWGEFKVRRNGVDITIPAGSSSANFVYWTYADGAFTKQESADLPTGLTADDYLAFVNKNGVALDVNSTQVIDGSLLIPETVRASAIAAIDIAGESIIAGQTTSGHSYVELDKDGLRLVNNTDGTPETVVDLSTIDGSGTFSGTITGSTFDTGKGHLGSSIQITDEAYIIIQGDGDEHTPAYISAVAPKTPVEGFYQPYLRISSAAGYDQTDTVGPPWTPTTPAWIDLEPQIIHGDVHDRGSRIVLNATERVMVANADLDVSNGEILGKDLQVSETANITTLNVLDDLSVTGDVVAVGDALAARFRGPTVVLQDPIYGNAFRASLGYTYSGAQLTTRPTPDDGLNHATVTLDKTTSPDSSALTLAAKSVTVSGGPLHKPDNERMVACIFPDVNLSNTTMTYLSFSFALTNTGSISIASGKFLIAKTGFYRISGQVRFNQSTPGNAPLVLNIRQNATSISAAYGQMNGVNVSLCATPVVLQLTAGDTVDLGVQGASGIGVMSAQNATYLSVVLD